jgi:hypothetical protein
LVDEERESYEEHLRIISERRQLPPTWTIFIPGSFEKIALMCERDSAHCLLHHPFDAVIVDQDGLLIRVGPNGRIVSRELARKMLSGLYEKLAQEADEEDDQGEE